MMVPQTKPLGLEELSWVMDTDIKHSQCRHSDNFNLTSLSKQPVNNLKDMVCGVKYMFLSALCLLSWACLFYGNTNTYL